MLWRFMMKGDKMSELSGLSNEEIKILMQMLKSDVSKMPELSDSEVEIAKSGIHKLHKQVNFHSKSWSVETSGGNLWTSKKPQAQKRFKDNVSRSKKNQTIAFYEHYRGNKSVVAAYPKPKT